MRHSVMSVFLLAGLVACSPVPLGSEELAFQDRQSVVPQQAGDPYYQRAEEAVLDRAGPDREARAKNVILFVGDGMGVSTLTAARIYAGQRLGGDGESHRMAMETLPHAALSRTYSHDYQVADSASTATAMVSGFKTKSRVVGLRSGVSVGNCASGVGQGSDTLFELAEMQGLATGVVSTARITHATPAAVYAESVHRDWEDDSALAGSGEGCTDIARQLIDWAAGDGFEIVLGGGRAGFMPAEMADPEYEERTGNRQDGRDLMGAWTSKSAGHSVIFDRDGFEAIDFGQPVQVLGLFEPSHMVYDLDRLAGAGNEPSIADLTRAAITRLSQQDQGYMLMVEGGRIDHAHHGVNAARALGDTVAFDEAVATALALTSPEDTLIIVTADHSHTMTMAGYPRRNNPILGKVVYETGAMARAADGKPYTTLGYANGETGCRAADCQRSDLSAVDTLSNDYQQQAAIFMPSETHGGEDVAIFASGPGSELVRGVMDQNELFHVMGFSAGLVSPSGAAGVTE